MSVTITIANNHEHCTQNNLVEKQPQECVCFYPDTYERPQASCHYCGGTGKYLEEFLPFEMNISSDNFRTLWSSLGLDVGDWSGSIDGRTVLRALQCGSELCERADRQGGGDGKARWIDLGITAEQAQRYYTRLKEIADEASRREEQIIWG